MLTHYKKISVEGFQSFGNPVSFILDRGASITMVKGLNGHGKSTIFNALLWAEYGINQKNSIATWEENRPATFRGTRVVVERTDGVYDYMIARHHSFKGTTKGIKGGNSLMIFRKSVEEPTFESHHLLGDGLHKSDMQEMIAEQIGVDANTFLNSILFGQRMKSLVESDAKDKRALFESVFPMSFVEDALNKAKEHEYEIAEDMRKMSGTLDTLEYKQEHLRKQIESNNVYNSEYAVEHGKKLEALKDELDTKTNLIKANEKKQKALKTKLEGIDLTKYEELKTALEEEENVLHQRKNTHRTNSSTLEDYNRSIAKRKQEIDELKEQIENVATECPSCKGPLSEDKVEGVKKELRKQIKSLQESVDILETKKVDIITTINQTASSISKWEQGVEELRTQLTDFKDLVNTETQLKVELGQLNTEISYDKKSVDDLTQKIESLENESIAPIDNTPLEEELKTIDKDIVNISATYENKQDELQRCQWWIKKGFGANGLKSYIFDAMLNQLNMYTQKYASRLGFGVQFAVDLTKASKPFTTLVYFGDKVKDYKDFSGGQKQRVDICIAFAMHDLISHKTDINVLILDEFFEGLDEAGRESALDLIRQKAETKSLYIITHSDIIDSMNTKSIYMELDETGNTKILV